MRQWSCLQCQQTFETADVPVQLVKCPECKSSKFLRAIVAEPSPVTGVGANREADLGYRLLLEAQV